MIAADASVLCVCFFFFLFVCLLGGFLGVRFFRGGFIIIIIILTCPMFYTVLSVLGDHKMVEWAVRPLSRVYACTVRPRLNKYYV